MSEQTAPADPFAAGAGDPFAASAEQPPAPPPAPEQTPVAPEDIPTVNAEGEKIDPATGEVLAEQPAVEEAPAPEPQPAEAGDGQPPQEPPAAPAEAPEQPEAAAEPQTAPEAPVEPQEQPAPEAQPATPEEADAQPEAQPAAAADNGAQAQADAEAAADPGGKSPLRHYTLLYQTGDKVWTEYDLSTLADNMKEHAEVKDGVQYLRARNADHARRIAWIIFGRPENGVTVNPVAKSSWNPKRLAPAPPQPTRERLSIT